MVARPPEHALARVGAPEAQRGVFYHRMPGSPLSGREHTPDGAARAYRHKQGGAGLELPEKRIRDRAGEGAGKVDEALPGEDAP